MTRSTIGVVDLMSEILREAPALPGALCRGLPERFDVTDPALAQDAITFCRRCPEARPCGEWAQRQRRDAVSGVLAGRVVPNSSTAAARRRI